MTSSTDPSTLTSWKSHLPLANSGPSTSVGSGSRPLPTTLKEVQSGVILPIWVSSTIPEILTRSPADGCGMLGRMFARECPVSSAKTMPCVTAMIEHVRSNGLFSYDFHSDGWLVMA